MVTRANFKTATVEQQQEAPADEVYLAFQETLERIQDGFDKGDLSEEEADQLEAQALADYQDILAEELGIEVDEEEYDDEEGEGDYADGTPLATFSAGTQLGAAVLELGEAEGYDTVEALVDDLSTATGFDPDDLAALISGEITVDDFEDPELAAHTLAQAFSTTASDEDAYDGFMQMAAEEAGYDVDSEEEADGVDYSRYRLELDREARLNSLEANFAQAQFESAVQQELMELTREADLGFQEGWLPPAAYKSIIGEFEMDSDRFAAFSSVCTQNEVSPEVELYAMRKQLEAFRRVGPMVQFGRVVQEDLSPDEEQELRQTQSAAKAYASRVNKYVGE